MKPTDPKVLYWKQKVLLMCLLLSSILNFSLLIAQTNPANQQYLKATLGDSSITVLPESYIHTGAATPHTLYLEQIPMNTDGYVEFIFQQLVEGDRVSVGLENGDGSHYYQMDFENNDAQLTDHTGTRFLLSTNARNNSLYRIKKCGNTIIWSDDTATPILTQTLTTDEPLWAKVSVGTITHDKEAYLELIFDTDSNYETCQKCTATGGQTLLPGDIMFVGYDNSDANSGLELVVQTLVPLVGGTSFSLMQGYYDTAANRWYSDANNGNNGNIAIQQITYTGTATIPAGAILCFFLPATGNGDALLATNFAVNGIANDNFCVENVGNTVNPLISLSGNDASALFLTQGGWKLLDAHGEFYGNTISGLQYGGNWQPTGQAPQNGLSNIPADIACIGIEDGLSPANRHAYYNGGVLNTGSIANFANWQTGSGALQGNVCGTQISLTEIPAEDSNRTSRIAHSGNHSATYFPNPFKDNFTLQLVLSQAQSVRITIYDSSGRTVYRQQHSKLSKGYHTLPISLPASVSDVVLWSRIQLDKEIIVKRLVKQGKGIQSYSN